MRHAAAAPRLLSWLGRLAGKLAQAGLHQAAVLSGLGRAAVDALRQLQLETGRAWGGR